MTVGDPPGKTRKGRRPDKARRGLWHPPGSHEATQGMSRLEARLEKVRRRSRVAMFVVGIVSVLFGSVLVSALRVARTVGDEPSEQAAWLGLAILVGANVLAFVLFRMQQKVLNRVTKELEGTEDGSGGELKIGRDEGVA